jgi:ribosome-binding protein aMBF1 (putative translation factor)
MECIVCDRKIEKGEPVDVDGVCDDCNAVYGEAGHEEALRMLEEVDRKTRAKDVS